MLRYFIFYEDHLRVKPVAMTTISIIIINNQKTVDNMYWL